MNWPNVIDLVDQCVRQFYQFLSIEGDRRVWPFGNFGQSPIIRYDLLIGVVSPATRKWNNHYQMYANV